jgi:hypothetical protein
MKMPLLVFCMSVLLMAGASAVFGCGHGDTWGFAKELGHRHTHLHRVAHVLAYVAIPLAVLGWSLLCYYRSTLRARARDGACLGHAARRLCMLPFTAYVLMLAPAFCYFLFSWVLDATFDWDCAVWVQLDFARERAREVAAYTGVAGGVLAAWGLWRGRRGHRLFRWRTWRVLLWPPIIAVAWGGAFLLARMFWYLALLA